MTFYNTLRLIVWLQVFIEVAKALLEKFSKCFLESKIIFYSWEKKTKVKVHLQTFWNQKGPVNQKCSSSNVGIRMYLWNIFCMCEECFFSKKNKEFGKKRIKWNTYIKKCHFLFIFGKLWQNSRPVCYSNILNWNNNGVWCLCLSRL